MPTYKVTDPKSGKTLRITGETPPTETQLNEIFSKVSSVDSTVQPPKEKSVVEKFSDFVSPVNQIKTATRVLSIPSEMVGGGLKATREAASGDYQAPKIGPDFSGIQGNEMNLGEALPPFVTGMARGVRDRTPVMDELPKTIGVNPDSLAGMGIGLAGELATPDPLDALAFAKAGKKIAQKVGGTIDEAGENLVLKGLKVSKNQVAKFKEKTGEELADFLKRNQITDNFVEKTGAKIRETADAYDEIVMKSGIKIKPQKLLDAMTKKAEEIRSGIQGILPQKRKLAQGIEELRDEFANDLPKFMDDSGNIDISVLTTLRRGMDEFVPDNQFLKAILGDSIGPTTQARFLANDVIYDATSGLTGLGKTARELGKELQKLKVLAEIAGTQAGLGMGASPFGLYDLIAAGVGTTLGSNPWTKIANAAVTTGARRLITNPKVIGAASTVMQKTGEAMKASKTMPKILEGILRVGKEGAINLTHPQQDQ